VAVGEARGPLGLALLTAASYVELITRFLRAGGAAVFAHRPLRSGTTPFLVGFCGLAAAVTSVGASSCSARS
jgi:amino acid transporter